MTLVTGLFASGVALSAALIALAVYFPATDLARRVADVAPLGVVHAARAEGLAATAGAGNRRVIEEVGHLTLRELHEAPASSAGWLRLARVYAATNSGRLDDHARAALSWSYKVAPIDYTIARPRLLFIFDHWTEVDRDVRVSATNEMKVLWLETMLRTRLEQLPAMTSDGAGRMAAELLIESLRNGNVSF